MRQQSHSTEHGCPGTEGRNADTRSASEAPVIINTSVYVYTSPTCAFLTPSKQRVPRKASKTIKF